MKKLCILILTVSTLGLVVLVARKFNLPAPPQPPVVKIDPDGGFNLIPDRHVKKGTYEEALDSINEANLKRDLYYLASNELEGRMSGKIGNKLAAEYLKKQYESFGLQTMYHKFNISRWNPGPKNEVGDNFTQNVYAWIEGTDPILKDEIVVIGAHMDHIGYGPKASQTPGRREVHPGADDNASGTVALLEIARAFSQVKHQVKRTVVFMSFSGEEMGLLGSIFYVDNPVFPKDGPSIKKHVAMINMDMIGYLKKGTYLASFNFNDSSPDLGKLITNLNGKYSFARSISGQGGGGSDHAPFYNRKVPVVCLHTGQHKNYHTPDDTADKINYKGLEQVTKYGFELSWRVATESGRPIFDHASYAPMPLTHDHGHMERPFKH